jgi:hypothetical protein
VVVYLANVRDGGDCDPALEPVADIPAEPAPDLPQPGNRSTEAGYHAIQSKVAIGSGGWLGTGYTQGPQKRLAFLPEQHTDFVFSVVGEELGFAG